MNNVLIWNYFFCEPGIPIHCADELNSSVEGSAVLDIQMYFSDIRIKYPLNLVLAHLNADSTRDKFYETYIVNGNDSYFLTSSTRVYARTCMRHAGQHRGPMLRRTDALWIIYL